MFVLWKMVSCVCPVLWEHAELGCQNLKEQMFLGLEAILMSRKEGRKVL